MAAFAVLITAGALTWVVVPGNPRSSEPSNAATAHSVALPVNPGNSCYAQVVDARVTDPFRAPAQPWKAGNRGLEYDTQPGQPIHAAATGKVTFAGSVARELYVTIGHTFGLQTTYSYLSDIVVAKDQAVSKGQIIGHAAERFQLGLRSGVTYRDPSVLFQYQCASGHAYLVPVDQ